MSAQTDDSITLITTISKSGGRFIAAVPKKLEPKVKHLYGQHVRVRLEPVV